MPDGPYLSASKRPLTGLTGLTGKHQAAEHELILDVERVINPVSYEKNAHKGLDYGSSDDFS